MKLPTANCHCQLWIPETNRYRLLEILIQEINATFGFSNKPLAS
jgi:hypothetical protein